VRIRRSFFRDTVCGLLRVIRAAAEMPVRLDSSSVLEFHGDSYVELKLSNNVAKTFAYDMWFLPTKPNGQLLGRMYGVFRRITNES